MQQTLSALDVIYEKWRGWQRPCGLTSPIWVDSWTLCDWRNHG